MERRLPTPPKVKGSYFASCERDEGGQCLPASRSEAGGKLTKVKVAKKKDADKVLAAKGIKYSLDELETAANKAGHKLFDKHRSGFMENGEVYQVEFKKLSDLRKPDSESGLDTHILDDFEYVFFPSSGNGLDVATMGWDEAEKNWADKDGKIYTIWGDGVVYVVDVDVPFQKPKKVEQPSTEKPQFPPARDPNVKVGKYVKGDKVKLTRGILTGEEAYVVRYAEGVGYTIVLPGGAMLVEANKIKLAK